MIVGPPGDTHGTSIARSTSARAKSGGPKCPENRSYQETAIPQWLGSVRKARCVPSFNAAVL
jgi:hypothetical protein